MNTSNKNRWLVRISLLSLLSTWACSVERESTVHPSPQSVTVNEAQDWYEKKGSSQARSANDSPNDSRIAYWKYAVSTQLANGTPVVTVPLLYGFSTPIAITQGDYTLRPGQPALVIADKDQVKIQKKLLIAKDTQGNYISNVMVILPSKAYRNANKIVRKENFEGLIQIYDESETSYLVGLEYKNGRLVNTIKAGVAGGRASSAQRRENCYQGIYQRNPPAQVGGSSMSSHWRYIEDLAGTLSMPMAVDFDTQTGNSDYTWHLVDVQEVDCSQRLPTPQPVYDPTTDQGEWIISQRGPGGGVPGGTRTDPNGPQPIDEGSPDDLQPTDRFFYDMQHRSRGTITFTNEETNLILAAPNLITNIRNYIDLYNQKPEIVNFFNNYIVAGPDVRINNLKQKLSCFGTINDCENCTYKAVLYVDQPVSNSRETFDLGRNSRKVGHTFIGLEKRSATGETIRLVLGFYVVQEWQVLLDLSVAGAWGDDGNSQYDVSLTSDVSANQFFDLINTLKSVGDNSAPNYHIVNNNCTSFSYNLLSGVMTIPSGTGQIGFLGAGKNPADMCQDLREKAGQYGSKLTSGNNLTAPSTTNCN